MNGPIGIGVAVVRGNELYVATIGPAEAYLIRQARLSTLPDPHRERGLPTKDLEPDVWRGEISVGDSLVLVSPNVMTRLGPDELKDAMVTLHPQPAMEHLHHRFVAADGVRQRRDDRDRGDRGGVDPQVADARPGSPGRAARRGPGPLADPARRQRDRRRRGRPGVGLPGPCRGRRGVRPARRSGSRTSCRIDGPRTAGSRPRPPSGRRSDERRSRSSRSSSSRAACSRSSGRSAARTRARDLASLTVGEAALRTARDNLAEVFGPGVDLVDGDPSKALELLTGAYAALDTAAKNEIPPSTIDPLRKQAQAGLDRLYGVVPVAPATVLSFADSPRSRSTSAT